MATKPHTNNTLAPLSATLEGEVLLLEGDVLMAALNESNYRQICQMATQANVMDLAQVRRVDSSCIALLLDLLRLNPQLRFRALPSVLNDLTDLYETTPWIHDAA